MTKSPGPYILWLPSWYPNKLAPFDGDFIQRHARAAALYNDIHVIYAAPDERTVANNIDGSVNRSGKLTEHIIYFKKSRGFLGRIQAFLKWNKILKKRKVILPNIQQNFDFSLIHLSLSLFSLLSYPY